jgi:hypothetical protein
MRCVDLAKNKHQTSKRDLRKYSCVYVCVCLVSFLFTSVCIYYLCLYLCICVYVCVYIFWRKSSVFVCVLFVAFHLLASSQLAGLLACWLAGAHFVCLFVCVSCIRL